MPESVINIADLPTVQPCATFEEWRKNRGTYIGGSDVAAILGLSPYPQATPGNVWAEKVRALERFAAGDENLEPDMQTRFTHWGKRLESVVLDEYELRIGVKVPRNPFTLYRHPQHPFIGGTLDGDVFALPSGDKRIAEVKTTDTWVQYRSQMWGPDGSDEVPDWYYAQAMQYMIVRRAHGEAVTMCDFAVLIGGNDFRILHVRYDEEIAETMIAKQVEFWQLVERRSPPPFDYRAPGALDLQRKIWTRVNGPIRVVPPDYKIPEVGTATALDLLERQLHAAEQVKHWEAEEEAAKAELMHMTGEAAALRIGDGDLGCVRRPKPAYHVEGYDVAEGVEFSFQPRTTKKRKESIDALRKRLQG